jgi:hypothetical protein
VQIGLVGDRGFEMTGLKVVAAEIFHSVGIAHALKKEEL